MSDLVTKPSFDEEATSGTSKQSSWMSHWMKGSSKPASATNNSSLVLYNEQVDQKSGSAPKFGKGMNVGSSSTLRTQAASEFDHKNLSLALAEDRARTNLINDNSLRANGKRLYNLFAEYKGNAGSSSEALNKSGPTCTCNNAETSTPLVEFERHYSNDNFTCLDKGKCKYKKFSALLLHEKKTNTNISHELQHGSGYDMEQNLGVSKNFFPLFLKQQCRSVPRLSATGSFPCPRHECDGDQPKPCHTCLSSDQVPCALHNVETMRICTMVDSLEHSSRGRPKVSQRAHHFLFTKETCLNLSKDCQPFREPMLSAHLKEKTYGETVKLSPNIRSSHQPGVRIEPLSTTSDDAEIEPTGNPLISKPNSRNESSVQADTIQTDDVTKQLIPSGMASSHLKKDAIMDASTEKARSKRPITEILDINEQVTGLQPEGSSTDSKEASTSRVHSFNAKNLFPGGEQTTRPELNTQQDHPCVDDDASNRWIKRLRASSDDSFGVGAKMKETAKASCRKKIDALVDKLMQPNTANLDPMLNKQHQGKGKEQVEPSQNTQPPEKSQCPPKCSVKETKKLLLGCPWIKRWRRDPNAAPTPPVKNPKPAVSRDPHSTKVMRADEPGRKQFPSIAAMALMGKTMNGFRSCEIKKKGSVVVWNTKQC